MVLFLRSCRGLMVWLIMVCFYCWWIHRNNVVSFFLFYLFYLSHTWLYREYITSSEIYSLHFKPILSEHTPEQWQPCYTSARGAVGGSCLAQGHLSRGIEGEESAGHSLPPPTIPAGPEIQTHNLPLTSPTRYPLGHDCPIGNLM